MGNFLIVNEEPQKADVIIVLSGGSERLPYGARLYQSGYADKVLISGESARIPRLPSSMGIPESSLLLEGQSTTTFENAKYSLKIVQAHGYKSAIVVTSPYHTRRASIIFAQVFKGIKLTICPVPYDPAMTSNWWKDSGSARFVISEYLKLGWHYLFDRI